MYVQSKNKVPRKETPETGPLPVLSSVREVTRFITSSSGKPEFKSWDNHEIRLKPPPSEHDLKALKIDLNYGFEDYWKQHCSQPKHIKHHQNGVPKGLEKDEVLRKMFEASLKWIKDNHLCEVNGNNNVLTTDNKESPPSLNTEQSSLESKADSPDSGHPPLPLSQPPNSDSPNASLSPTPTSLTHTTTTTTTYEHMIQISHSSSSSLIQEELLADLLIADDEPPDEGLIPMQRSASSATTSSAASSNAPSSVSSSLASQRPKLITTANALYLLLQLPYESDERSGVSWLVSKHQGTLFVFSLENDYSKPQTPNAKGRTNHTNGHNHHNDDSPAILAEKANELIKYRTKVFFNLMTERLPLNCLIDKTNRCVINEAFFDGHRILYSAIINAVNLKDKFVDLRLNVPKRTRREHLEKMQKVWSMAVVKPSSEIIIGTRSTKKESNTVPEGRLIDIEKYHTSKIPAEVADFTSARTTCEAPLWHPSVSYEFLKRFIEFLDNRIIDDPKTVYQIIPEGFYGRGFSLLSIQKLNLKGCDPLIPNWFVRD
jgi:hypothetical protein